MKLFRFIFNLLILVFLAGSAQAEAPWGISKKIVEDTTFSIYAIDNLIDDRPIRYAVGPGITPQKEEIFKDNIHKWPAETLRFIRAAKPSRTQEFQDIIPFLEREIVLQKVSLEDSPDIYVYLTPSPDDCGRTASGCFDKKGQNNPYSSILVLESHKVNFKEISLHEIGHYFGLGDQYSEGLYNSHREYSSDVNETCGSVMNESNVITEDDADGFINLIDLRLAQRNGGQFSKRARDSWKSLCPNSSNTYRNARTKTRRTLSTRESDDTTLIVRKYKNGVFQKEGMLEFPLDPLSVFTFSPGQDKVQRDKKSPFIRAIYKTVSMMTELADGQQLLEQVSYKISFSYGEPFLRNNKKVIPLSVRETLDGQNIRTREVTISQDGEVLGIKNLQLEKGLYIARTDENRISLSFSDGKPGFSCTIDEMHERSWYNDANTGHFTEHGRERTTTLPPGPNSRAGRYWHICNARKEAIENFYKNFYDPLFSTTQQDAQKQVKQALKRK